MYSAIEMFKFLFANLWIEHILYLILEEEEVGLAELVKKKKCEF